MLDQAEQEKINLITRTNRLIYMSFVTAVGMYVFVTYVVTRSGSEGMQVGALREALIVASILAGAAKFWITRKQSDARSYEGCADLDAVIGKYGSYFFMSLAMCEIPTLCGMIIVFLTRQMGEWTVFLAIAIVLFATSAPRAGIIESVVEANRTRQFMQNT